MEKHFEISELKNLSQEQINNLKQNLENAQEKQSIWASRSRAEAERRWKGCSDYFLVNDSAYQKSLDYKKTSRDINREIKILEICNFPNLLNNPNALQKLAEGFYWEYGQQYEFSLDELDLLISTFTDDEIINNEELLEFLKNKKITRKLCEFLQSKYLQKNLTLLEEAIYSRDIDYNDLYKKFIELTDNPIIINNDSIRACLPKFTNIIYENRDIFGSEKITNNQLFLKQIIFELENYNQASAKKLFNTLEIDNNNQNKKENLRLKYLAHIFISSHHFNNEQGTNVKTIIKDYKDTRVKIIEEALDIPTLKSDPELLFSLLAPYTFIKTIIRRSEDDKIIALEKILSKYRENSTLEALYQLLRHIKPLEEKEIQPIYKIIDTLSQIYVKQVSIDNFLTLRTIIDKVCEINQKNANLVINACRILEETPILKTHPHYIWALLLKDSVKDQDIFEKFMQIEEVRRNFTYNNGNSFYGFLLSLEKYINLKEFVDNYDPAFYIIKKEEGAYITEWFEDVFSVEGLQNFYQYDDETDSIVYKSVEDIYRKAIGSVLNSHEWICETDRLKAIEEIYILQGEELRNEFISFVSNHYNDGDVDYDVLAETILKTNFDLLKTDEVQANNKVYTNPNKLVYRKVKEL